MRVLLVGSGGREHALAWALARSPLLERLDAAPGNPGIATLARCHPVPVSDLEGMTRLAQELAVDLVVVGPEAPLVSGLANRLSEAGIGVFGPSAAAAQIEGSKAFAKSVMEAAGVPTARFTICDTVSAAHAAIAEADGAVVVKADGLAAGKGVVVCSSAAEAHAAVAAALVDGRFGASGRRVLIEERLEGEELSLLALCDGERAIPLAPAQDFKRIFDGDEGPNTGGMGSYSPVPGAGDPHELAAVVHQPLVDELRRRGTPFHGVLYAGLMLSADGPRVIEYNARFGDPETQAVLPRLRGDLLELLRRAAQPGGLEGATLEFADDAAVTVVLASAGYPASSSSGDVISGLDDVPAGVEITHAGTARRKDGAIVTAGGRVLNVTGVAPDPAAARQRAYDAAAMIDFDGKQLRTDIAARAVDAVTAH
ncbi:MAG: phosphoribosylamine--glycine ligase [Solirubrobacterales bacterium]